jgi:transposase InsO family protein
LSKSDRRRHRTPEERLELIQGYRREGGRVADYGARHGVSESALRKWMARYAAQGPEGLVDQPNPRNHGGRSRGRYSPEERRAILEALERSGMRVRDFARTWGVALNSLATWRKRYAEQGPKGLEPRGRRPGSSEAQRLAPALRAEIRETQRLFPDFGLRKLRDFLKRFRGVSVSPGAIRRTLDEAGIAPQPSPKKRARKKPMPPRRFERSRPGELWQSDITSFLLTRHSTRVYLTVFLDDFSRYVVSFALATHQRGELVTETLMEGIARFGKPLEVLTDQGRQYFAWRSKSDFQKTLDREGIRHVVSRTHHPETLGKCERLWETINTELWERTRPQDLSEARERLAHWFAHYNHFRPHQGIDGLVPADRFFGAEDVVRAKLEAQMAANELQLALGEPLRKPVFLFGQIGDQAVSLHGERGRLVLQTSDGERKEVGLEEIGMPQASEEERDGRRDTRGGDGRGQAQADAALQEAAVLQGAEAGGGGEGPVGAGERGGAAASPQDLRLDAGALARPQDEGRDGRGAIAAAPAGVAIEPVGAVRHAGGPLEATEESPTRSSAERGERGGGAAQGERSAAQGERGSADGERSPEGPAPDPGEQASAPAEGARGEKGAPPSHGTTSGPAGSWGSGSLSAADSLGECWLSWLEGSRSASER